MKVFVTSNWHKRLASNWCHTLTANKFVLPKCFFCRQYLFSPINFCSWSFLTHILDIILTSSCVDVHTFSIWQQQDVKIRSIDVVPSYWPIFCVDLTFKCPLCISTYFTVQETPTHMTQNNKHYDNTTLTHLQCHLTVGCDLVVALHIYNNKLT